MLCRPKAIRSARPCRTSSSAYWGSVKRPTAMTGTVTARLISSTSGALEAPVELSRRPHELVPQVDRPGDMDGIHTALLLQIGGHRGGVLDALTAVQLVAGVDAAEDGHDPARLAPDVLHDQPGQAEPVLEAAAELVGAVIGALRQEGAHQIAVGTVDLHHVQPRQLGPAGGVPVALDQAVDLVPGHLPGDLPPAGGGDRAGRLQGVAGEGRTALRPRVLELDGYLSPIAVAGLRHPAKAVDGVVGKETGLPRTALGLLIDHSGLDGDQPEAPWPGRRSKPGTAG